MTEPPADHTLTPDEQWAWDGAARIKLYGDTLGEPVHLFVECKIRLALLAALEKGRRETA
jgi:hypothetical protein